MKITVPHFVWLLTVAVLAFACGGKESTDAPPKSQATQSDEDEAPAAAEAEQNTPVAAMSEKTATTTAGTCNRDLNETQCKQVDGDFGPHGKAQMRYCICPTSDSGKVCTDNSACEGYCECNGPDDTKGRCSARVRRFGCFCKMNGGKPVRICMD